MALFVKKNETDEQQEEELDYINLDDTEGWNQLEIAQKLAEQENDGLKEGSEPLREQEADLEELSEDEIEYYDLTEENDREAEADEQNKNLGESFCERKVTLQQELSEDEIEYYDLTEENDGEAETDEYDEEESSSLITFFEGIYDYFAGWTVMDKVVAMVGVLVLIVAIFTASAYAGNHGMKKQIAAFVPLGEQLNTVGAGGAEKLLAVADAQKAMYEATKLEEELNQKYEENELDSQVQVVMKMTSVQKDLKIKFTNKKSGKLVGNAAFEIEITDPDSKKYNKIDEDKDGIIYLSDITAGNYSICMVEAAGLEDYTFSTAREIIKVKEKIDYEKIDVSDEIKDQSEVDVAKEDTAQKTETEGVLQDTVEWVESTKTPIGGDEKYTKVDKGNIADPGLSASLTLDLEVLEIMQRSSQQNAQVSGTVSDNGTQKGEDEQKVPVTGVVLNVTEVSLDMEGKTKAELSAMIVPENATNKEIVWKSDNTQVAEVKNGVVTAVGKGTAVITAVSADDDAKKATCTVKVKGTEQKPDIDITPETDITLEQTAAVLKVGESFVLKATAAPEGETITFTSANAEVAKVNKKGKVTAVSEGETVITAAVGDKKAECKVTVKKADSQPADGKKALKDKAGNQIYILKEGKYVEATAADYYNYNEFYKKESASEYRYTGWQELDGKTYFFDKDGNKVTGEQVIQGAKYNFNSDGSLNKGSGTLGIDVSTWNGTIDWNKVKGSGVSYVIIRTGFRGSTQGALVEDNRFRQNIQGAVNAGLKVGVYFFSQAVNEVEAVEEASMVLSQVKGYALSYPVFIDVEPSGGRADRIDAGTRTKVVNAFCQTIQNSGYKAGIYANKTWLNEKLNASALSGYKIWLAQYNTHVTYGGRYDMWQYSEKGKVNGISGNVDMNLSYLSY